MSIDAYQGRRSRLGASVWLVLSIASGGCDDQDASNRENTSEPAAVPLSIEPRRSLVVTEQEILEGFSLERVMDQLAERAGTEGLTGITMFKQWWDTQNAAPGLALGAHCDDQLDATYDSSINGFPYSCRPTPEEGDHASCTSFSEPACAYIPVGLFNRFDLAAPDGAHCGEYRIVYAKSTGQSDALNRNLVIFEAALRNPRPEQGLAGCLPIMQHWARLTSVGSANARAKQLESFYFVGTSYFGPVIDPSNFGDNALGAGQIRTNQFMGQTPTRRVWTLREFKLLRACSDEACPPLFVPVTNKANPFGPLFSSTAAPPKAAAFQAAFLDEVAPLAAASVEDIGLLVADTFNSAQSHSSGSNEMRYLLYFGREPGDFRNAIQDQLTTAASTLTPEQVVLRAQTQTCAGCHQLSNNADLGDGQSWPPSLGFVHVTERDPETVNGAVRFRLSPALTDIFLPVRKRLLEDYLNGRPLQPLGRAPTIGGRLTH